MECQVSETKTWPVTRVTHLHLVPIWHYRDALTHYQLLCPAVESQFAALLDQTEKEDSVPQAVRHYMHEMAELTELAKERLDQVKVQ